MPGLLASVDDLRILPGVTLNLDDDGDYSRAVYLLKGASAQVVASLGWDPLLAQRTYKAPAPARTMWLPAMNVSALTVAIDGVTVSDVAWESSGRVDFGRRVGYWGAWGCDALFTFTAGWSLEDMPDAIVTACLEAAATRLVNPAGARTTSWSTGSESESVTYAGDPTVYAEDVRLSPYQLLRVAA
jgi:hypothetical protein